MGSSASNNNTTNAITTTVTTVTTVTTTITKKESMGIIKTELEGKLAVYKNDYELFNNSLKKLHVKERSTREMVAEGYAVVSEKKFAAWCEDLASEIVSDTKLTTQEVTKKILKFKNQEKGVEYSRYVDLSYDFGGESFLGMLLFAMVNNGDGTFTIVWGKYVYKWQEDKNWRLNPDYWKDGQVNHQILAWLCYKSGQRGLKSLE